MATEIKAIKFKNFTDQAFTHSFDSVPYTFAPGMEMFLKDFEAYHFTKHLVDRELNKKNIPTNNMVERAKLEKLALPSDEVVSELEAMQIETPKKKAAKKVATTEEFES